MKEWPLTVHKVLQEMTIKSNYCLFKVSFRLREDPPLKNQISSGIFIF